jgi:hypothetical protein
LSTRPAAPAPRADQGILDKLTELKATLEKSKAEQLAEKEKVTSDFLLFFRVEGLGLKSIFY